MLGWASHSAVLVAAAAFAVTFGDAADSLAMLLGLDDHEVRAAYTARTALALASSFRPEACILDLGLPDLSGYEVARLLRQVPGLEQLRLIALTG